MMVTGLVVVVVVEGAVGVAEVVVEVEEVVVVEAEELKVVAHK